MNTVSTPVVLTGISFRHGSWRELDDLVTRGLAGPADVARLTAGGLRRYAVAEKPMREHYPDCVAETLSRASVKPADVDAVVFFSSTFSTYDNHTELIELNRALGMTSALPIGLFEAQCSNFSYALMVALALIRAQGLRSVLLVGADALDEDRADRLLPGSVSVFSDTVVSCLVSSELAGGLWVEHVGHAVDPELAVLDQRRDLLQYMDRFTRALDGLCTSTYRRTGAAPADFSHLVLANLATDVLKNYAAVARIPFSRVPTGNIGTFAHCFAYDQLITLATLLEDGELTEGDLVHVLGVGATYLFSSTVVRCL
jgi:3-oxoacyl-[acyl-carrier-protein] synthase III